MLRIISMKSFDEYLFRLYMEESESGEGSARSICDDTFSVFAFLAFILALTSLGFSVSGSSSKE